MATYVGLKLRPLRSEMIVSTAWLAAHLNDPKVVILHVARARAHYVEGHIPGARFAAWDEITATRRIGDDARIVLYGDNSGLSVTSLDVARELSWTATNVAFCALSALRCSR